MRQLITLQYDPEPMQSEVGFTISISDDSLAISSARPPVATTLAFAQLRLHAPCDGVHLAGEAVYDAALHAGHGVAAYH